MLYQKIDLKIEAKRSWALRRQLGIPNNRRLWVLACMDERLPVDQALGIEAGDAHVFRNAGGLVTDDAIRSAALTTNFFGTREIIVVNHTECGMMTTTGEQLCQAFKARGVDPETTPIDPALPELRLAQGGGAKWFKTFTDVDAACARQVELLRTSPFIPDDVEIHGYVWDVESRTLRRPFERSGGRARPGATPGAEG